MSDLKITPPTRQAERVQDRLLEQILSGELVPGDQLLPERELARALGVGRPSVREGLSSLASMGLLSVTPRGSVVRAPDLSMALSPVVAALARQEHALLEFVEFRRILEVGAVRLAAIRARAADLHAIEQAIDLMEAKVSVGADPLVHDVEFHLALCRASHNVFVNQMISLVVSIAQNAGYAPILAVVYSPPGELQAWIARSRAVLAAVQARSPEQAAAEMAGYLNRVEQLVQAYFARQTEPGETGAAKPDVD